MKVANVGAAIRLAPLLCLWMLVRVLPSEWGSRLGAFIGPLAGRFIGRQRRIRRNLRHVYPNADHAELRAIETEVWRNAGATLAELPNLDRILARRTDIEIAAQTQACLDRGERLLFVSAHLANWELIPKVLVSLAGPIVIVFMPQPNPILTRWLQGFRRHPGTIYVEKEGALAHMMRARKMNANIGLLGDTRVDSGEMLDLCGKPAPTSIAAYRVAHRLGYRVVTVHAERTVGERFRIQLDAPLEFDTKVGREAAIRMAEAVNRRIERWLAIRPNQWWCAKRRWLQRSEESAHMAAARESAHQKSDAEA